MVNCDQKQLIEDYKVHMEHIMLGRKTNADILVKIIEMMKNTMLMKDKDMLRYNWKRC